MEDTIKSGELEALIGLLDDPDEDVFEAVRKRLIELGSLPIARLQVEAATSKQPIARRRAAHIVHAIQERALNSLTALLTHHRKTNTNIDLEEALLLLDAFGNPEADRAGVSSYLDALALRVHELFITKQPANDLTHILSITTVLYDEEDFQGAEDDFYDPANSYLSTLIDNKVGIPISLAVLIILIADRVGLRVDGIAMPFHFLLQIPEVELMIDPFTSGTFITRDDCIKFIVRSGVQFADSMLDAVGSNDIVIRMMRNLVLAHEKHSDVWEAQRLTTALTTLGVKVS